MTSPLTLKPFQCQKNLYIQTRSRQYLIKNNVYFIYARLRLFLAKPYFTRLLEQQLISIHNIASIFFSRNADNPCQEVLSRG